MVTLLAVALISPETINPVLQPADVVNTLCRWMDSDKDSFPQFRHLLGRLKNNLTLFEKTPCIHPVWDPGSPSGLVLTCSGLSLGGREREDDQIKERIGWTKVKMRVCGERERERVS